MPIEFAERIRRIPVYPVAAGYANRAVFLNDGRIVDEMPNPTPEAILDRMKGLGE